MPGPGGKPLKCDKKPYVVKVRSRPLMAGLLGLAVLAPLRTFAGTLDVVVTAAGKPVADAVVVAVPKDNRSPFAPSKAKAVMLQQGQQFQPFVLPVMIGTTVDFPNRDTFRHHVYSFSPAKAFELKLYGGGEVQSITFDKEGVVALGCNIHDNMLAYVFVSSSPYYAKTQNDGKGAVAGLPAGAYAIHVWHPDQRAGPPIAEDVIVPAEGEVHLDMAINLKREHKQRRPGAVDENAY